jgi:AcrR family transcriptional regulator
VARRGTASKVSTRGSSRSADTRRQLTDAAIESLKVDGFAGTSARAIAQRSGLTQGLIFYHYGSVANLLLAALDSISAERMAHYSAAIDRARTPSEVVDVAMEIFREDLDAGYVTVLVEMIAGASSTPGMGAEVSARLAPWFRFAERAVNTSIGGSAFESVVPVQDIAYGIVALYLGLEMLTNLAGDRTPTLNLFAHGKNLAGILEALSPSLSGAQSPPQSSTP